MSKGIWVVAIVLLLGVAAAVIVRKEQSQRHGADDRRHPQGHDASILEIR